MQTRFTEVQLAEPEIAAANEILRTCVHCGFCTATCPTYVLTGDELDGPRGRIYLIKEMLEAEGADADAIPAPDTVLHIDRCLSCLACMTTCPASVNYMHLVDIARARIEERIERPRLERWWRALVADTVSRPDRFRTAAVLGRMLAPLGRRLPGRLGALAAQAPAALPRPQRVQGQAVKPGTVFEAEGERTGRVALALGCAQQVLAPQINEATIRVLTRHGLEVVLAEDAVCCGSLDHHLGRAAQARSHAAAAIAAWDREITEHGLDAIVVNTSGCGTTIKDYGFIYRTDAELAAPATRIAERACDVSEVLAELALKFVTPASGASDGATAVPDLKVAYHAHCSLQHGQGITRGPADLLRAAGFAVVLPADAHLCCGSAGSYSLLQPALAGALRSAKAAALEADDPDLVATGNVGCMAHLAPALAQPIVHMVELIDWATGGPLPRALAKVVAETTASS